jgi:hypothetical protein
MKKILVAMVFLFGASSAMAAKLECAANKGHQGIKTVCLLKNKEQDIRGLLFFNANNTKSYFVVERKSEAFHQQPDAFYIVESMRLVRADQNLRPLDNTRVYFAVTHAIVNNQRVQWQVTGTTSGLREVDATYNYVSIVDGEEDAVDYEN